MAKKSKFTAEYIRLVEKRVFKSEEDRKAFFDNLLKGLAPPSKREPLSSKDEAYNLIFDANNLPDDQGKKLADKALLLDPECIDAYEYLGRIEDSAESILNYRKGMQIGNQLFGGDYLKENQGLFWSIPETRSYMECLGGYGIALYERDRYFEAIQIFERIIRLNINDAMEVREPLMLSLIHIGDYKKFKKYEDKYEEDHHEHMLFNKALFNFKKSGDSDVSRVLLLRADKKNKYIIPQLISLTETKRLPDFDNIELDYIIAFKYMIFAKKIWKETDGAISWLRKNVSG